MGNKSGFLASSREITSNEMGTKELAATRIQTAFRANKVCVLSFTFFVFVGPTYLQ